MILISEQHAHLVIASLSAELSRAQERLVMLSESKSGQDEAISYLDVERNELAAELKETKAALGEADAKLLAVQSVIADSGAGCTGSTQVKALINDLLTILNGGDS